MAEITVRNSVLVRPATETPQHELWLSNLDLISAIRHSVTAYIYRRPPSGDFNVVQLLKDGLSKVLVHFYPLAGRLITDATGRLAVDCNGEGALFVEAATQMEIDDLADFSPSELKPLVPPAAYHVGITTSPLLMIQVTRFKCGGMSMGVGLHHSLVDGMSTLHFVNTCVSNFSGNIISNPIWQTSQMIYDGIVKMDDKYLRSQLDFLELQHDLSSFEGNGVGVNNPDLRKVGQVCPLMIRILVVESPFC
ncbi:shikimate O-hydroxycinnamoyltransferase-like [Cryptomeria japonica]|uniref:shikimate O-hydroxycinnamoyltransferase-like n=1 Tax=Cryptomeria japonica TaxID=3369 RepID=UPI0027DA5FEB|nr:shikimate O-hydroxycinnamoyltransferase-like [Cryptomeria japonica]